MTKTRRKGGAVTSTVEKPLTGAEQYILTKAFGFRSGHWIHNGADRHMLKAIRALVKRGLLRQEVVGNYPAHQRTEAGDTLCLRLAGRAELSGGRGAIKMSDMGKKRSATKKQPKTPRQQFAARLKELAGERPASHFAPLWGCNPDAVLKYLRGDRTPKLDMWPKIAASFGLKNWQDLLPPSE